MIHTGKACSYEKQYLDEEDKTSNLMEYIKSEDIPDGDDVH